MATKGLKTGSVENAMHACDDIKEILKNESKMQDEFIGQINRAHDAIDTLADALRVTGASRRGNPTPAQRLSVILDHVRSTRR